MRWAGARLLALLLLLGTALFGPAAAQPPGTGEPSTIVLHDAAAQIDAAPLARAWVDAGGEATIAQVSQSAGGPPFGPPQPDMIYRLGPRAALWLHLRVQRGAQERQDWVLEFPMPTLDLVTVYQPGAGLWRGESAGDTLPVDHWAEPGRYPSFRIDLPPGEVRELYVRIRNTTAGNFPMQLATTARQGQRLQLEYLGIGCAIGLLLLMIVGCLARAWTYRDAVFAWYAGYAALTTVGVASYTGVASHLLWPGFGALGDAPVPMLACAAPAAAMMFVRTVLGLRERHPLLDRLMLLLATAGAAVALLPALSAKAVHLPVVAGYATVATAAALLAAAVTWLRGDGVAKWVFWAYTPMTLSLLLGVGRVFGWVRVSAQSQYLVVVAIAVEVPLLLVALSIRSRDRHNAQVREQALSTRDALTGLLAPHLFTDRLRQVLARYRRDGLSAAVMVIELVNYGPIRARFGTAVAEQSLLRSVIKLRRLLRDSDTASRMGEAQFGVLLEGVGARAAVTERASHLIAAGLMPLPGLKPDVTLHFHVAAAMLFETGLDAEDLEQALRAQLARMSPRTRRPIRFLEAEALQSDPGESSLFPPAADEPAQPLAEGAAPPRGTPSRSAQGAMLPAWGATRTSSSP